MRVRCPQCQSAADLEFDPESAGLTCPSCGGEIPVLPATESVGPKHLPAPQGSPSALRSIDQFQLLEEVGAGTFGTVWKALDTELDRLVAVKIPRREQMQPADVEMFLREARAAARLKHPQIVAVHEVGRDDGSVFIVSDFIQGRTLAERHSQGPFTPAAAAELCAEIGEALHHAHEAGVIHRDLKPQNIMLDAAGRPHIMDFGLAKREAADVSLAVDGKILGTAAYMSPEQARGEAGRVDRRTDVYSLGVILYELLTGVRPFRSDLRILLQQVIHSEPPRPRRLNRGVPRDLETIALKCLEKSPNLRYAGAADVAAELRRWLAGKPILARPAGLLERGWRWARRNPVVAGLGGGVATLLIAVTIVGGWSYLRAASDALAKASLTQSERGARQETQRQLRVAKAEQLAAQALTISRDQPITAMLLAAAAVEVTAQHNEPVQPSAAHALRDTLSQIGGRPLVGQHSVLPLAMSGDGSRLVTGPERSATSIISGDRRFVSGGKGALCIWNLNAADSSGAMRLLGPDDLSVPYYELSADGRWLAIGGGNGVVQLWDLNSADPPATARRLHGHQRPIQFTRFSKDAGRLASIAYNEPTVRVWDLTAADPATSVVALAGPTGPMACLALSANGRRMATGSRDGSIHVWDLGTGDPASSARVLHGHPSWIWDVVLSGDGRWLVSSGGTESTARLWDLNAADPAASVKVLRHHTNTVRLLAMSEDGRRLVTGSDDRATCVWDWQESGDPVPRKLLGHDDSISALSLTPNGRWLVTASRDKSVRVWDLESADPAAGAQVLRGHDGYVQRIALSADGRRLVTQAGGLRRWDLPTAAPGGSVTLDHRRKGLVRSLVLTPDGRWLAAGGEDKLVRVMDLHAANPAATAREVTLTRKVQSVTLSADGRWLSAATGHDNAALVWDLRPVPPALLSLAGHANPVYCVAISADGRWLVSGSLDKTVRVWDLHAPDPAEQVRVLTGFQRYIHCLALSADGRRLAVGSDVDRVFDLHAANPAESVKLLGDQVGLTTCLAMGPNGRWLASGGINKLTCIWDLNAPNPAAAPKALPQHGQLEALAISRDGRWLATASIDKAVRLWDLQSHDSPAEAQHVRGQDVTVGLAFGPEGRWLVAADASHTTRASLLDPLDLSAAATTLAGGSLTADQQRRYGVPPEANIPSKSAPSGLPPILEKLIRP